MLEEDYIIRSTHQTWPQPALITYVRGMYYALAEDI